MTKYRELIQSSIYKHPLAYSIRVLFFFKTDKYIYIYMKLILDYSKWRCGLYDDYNQLGVGKTLMENDEGYCCCLGLFSPQLNPESKDCLLSLATPCGIQIKIPTLTILEDGHYMDTKLSIDAMKINDDGDTNPQEKIELLKELFGEHGHEIEVINQPL